MIAAAWVLGCADGRRDEAAPPPEDTPTFAALPGAPASWSAQAEAGIAATEYAPKADGASLRVTNRAQDLRGTFDDRGLTVTDRQERWNVSVFLDAWGRDEAPEPAPVVPPEEGECLAGGAVDAFGACLRRVVYQRPGLVEWWENRPEGLEHGFTVIAAPDGPGPLVFDLAVRGAVADVGKRSATLRRPGGGGLTYGDLRAWDSTGRRLPAWMASTADGLRLVVDDDGAIAPLTVDPLLASTAWSVQGEQEGARLGDSLASAGDVNGDGFGDVIVGAPYYEHGQTGEGAAFVYLGSSAGLSTTAAWSEEGDEVGAYFGSSVASAGDVNGDGYSDVVVGAPGWEYLSYEQGAAFVYHGSATGLRARAAVTLLPEDDADEFGQEVASAGDVNADGYGDVVVGVETYGAGERGTGAALVYLGSPTGLPTGPSWTAQADQEATSFGASVGGAGDVNGDGFGDLVVGAHNYTNGESSVGAAFVYLGSASGLSASPDWSATSDRLDVYFGVPSASAGDVNGDGYGDLVVGARLYDGAESTGGAAFVYLGSASGLSSSADWEVQADVPGAYFGGSAASAGDVNGDGYGDLVVGAFMYDDERFGDGAAFVYLGAQDGLATSPYTRLVPDQPDSWYGLPVASAGDVNGDGFGDILVGARTYTDGSSYEGAAFLYQGAASGPATSAAWSADPDQAGAGLGFAVASAGDVNGDGYGDVVVGAVGYDGGESDEGAAFVYFGSGAGLSATAGWMAEADLPSARFGAAVAYAGDIDGNGFGDVVIGAPGYRGAAPREGAAFVYLGSSSGLTTTAAWTASPGQAGAGFGVAVASAGDVNGDGFDDLVVGAGRYDAGVADEGTAWVYLGSPAGLSATAVWVAAGTEPGARFGEVVSPAGDVDGDGYADLLIGAPGTDGASHDEGAAFVYLGSTAGLSASAAWSDTGGQPGASFGAAAARAGDVNGDGFEDLVIGAPHHDNRSVDGGAAFVYLGSSAGPYANPAWTKRSTQAGANFGGSVASAGDVNGDGFGDLVVGAPRHDAALADEGAAFVYLGAPGVPETTATWTTTSGEAAARFGASVACAGDVNGDGFSDVLVGSPLHDDDTTDEGAAYVFLGNGAEGTTPLARPTWARDPGISTPIAPGLAATSDDSLEVATTLARGPWGRGRVQLQLEAKPLGTPFDGTGLETSTSYVDSGLTGAPLDARPLGLPAATGYHWRARVAADPAEGRPQGWGPWVYGGHPGSAHAAHVFTASRQFYCRDADGDGFGDRRHRIEGRAPPPGYVVDDTDCDDADAAIHPGATEVCDDHDDDEDCDGLSDDADPSATGQSAVYRDQDRDGYGLASAGMACDVATGIVVDGGDCDDNDDASYPGAPEDDCDDPRDYNCDGSVGRADADGDGFVACEDCDDAHAATYPSAPEADCTDPRDYNCDGSSGNVDADGDEFPACQDCDDGWASVFPSAVEVVGDGIDQNCDGIDVCYVDADEDGFRVTDGPTVPGVDLSCLGPREAPRTWPTGDCNDDDAAYHPFAEENDCTDPGDYNCDGSVGYVDLDQDGFAACEDCNDEWSQANPDATERCNGMDDDCDGTVDRDAVDASVWYTDLDGDGYAGTGSVVACDRPDGRVSDPDPADCDDHDADVHPGAEDPRGDGVDQDCDGTGGPEDRDGPASCGCGGRDAPRGWPFALWVLRALTKSRGGARPGTAAGRSGRPNPAPSPAETAPTAALGMDRGRLHPQALPR